MANEVRLIDANALNKRFDEKEAEDIELYGVHIAACFPADEAKEIVDQMPTIDPESLRRKGRWEKYWCEPYLIGHMYEVCPNCRSCEILDTDKFWDSNYCPNCGAKMEG